MAKNEESPFFKSCIQTQHPITENSYFGYPTHHYLVVQVSTTTQPWWRRLWLARKFAILSKETSSSAKEWVSWLPNPSRIWKQSNFFVNSKHKRLSNSYGSDLSFFYSSAKPWGPIQKAFGKSAVSWLQFCLLLHSLNQ